MFSATITTLQVIQLSPHLIATLGLFIMSVLVLRRTHARTTLRVVGFLMLQSSLWCGLVLCGRYAHLQGVEDTAFVRGAGIVGSLLPLVLWFLTEIVAGHLESLADFLRKFWWGICGALVIAALSATPWYYECPPQGSPATIGWGWILHVGATSSFAVGVVARALYLASKTKGIVAFELKSIAVSSALPAAIVIPLMLMPRPGGAVLPPLVVLFSCLVMAGAMASQKIFAARQIVRIVMQQVAPWLVASVIVYAIHAQAEERLPPYLLTILIVVMVLAGIGLCDRLCNRLALNREKGNAARLAINGAGQKQTSESILRKRMTSLLKEWSNADHSAIIHAQDSPAAAAAASALQQFKGCKHPRWVTVEALERGNRNSSSLILSDFMSRRGLSVMVEAGSGADAILVGMGNPPTGEPWTYPLVLELCELSLLVESTLSRNRMHASAVRAADQEILDRLQREETLRLSEQKYHKLFANMPAGMALFSLDGGVKDATKFTITETNPAFERYADILGKEGDNEAAISPPVRRQLSALVRRVSRSSLPVSLSNYAGFVKGRFFDLQLFAASENRVGLVLTETTERRKTEQRVLLSQRIESIGLMTSGLAHELTNTISPGMLALDLLKKRVDDNESRDTIDLIGKSLQRGADIISSILLFATGAQEKKILIHPAKVLKEVVEISRKTFPRDVTISLDVKNPVLLAMADGTKLHQVLTNIMINARDAMPSGGEIFLRMDALQSETGEGGMAPGNYICITVSDTGTGIPKEIQGKIFEPFFTTKQTGKGTGLGLSTAIRIVNEYGGRLTVKSEIGKGATFQVLLPSSSASTASAPVRLEVVGETRGAGRLVLIVDDELPIRLVATQVLKEHGFAAIAASNGAEAVDLLRASGATPSLAIIDLMMPFMGGGPLIDRLRSTHPLMRVIAISGMVFDASFEEKASDLRKKGVSLLLKKPFREASLLAAIRKVDTLPPWSGAEMPGVSGQGKPEKEQERAA